jgi:hypothetical protein
MTWWVFDGRPAGGVWVRHRCQDRWTRPAIAALSPGHPPSALTRHCGVTALLGAVRPGRIGLGLGPKDARSPLRRTERASLVETRGIEPRTSCLQSRRSTN